MEEVETNGNGEEISFVGRKDGMEKKCDQFGRGGVEHKGKEGEKRKRKERKERRGKEDPTSSGSPTFES